MLGFGLDMKPYIGITDFTSFQQVEKMLEVFNAHKAKDTKRVLHAGVMMSRKTMLDLPTEFAEAFPRKESIAGIFSSLDTYNCLHYADYGKVPDPELAQNLIKAISYGGEKISALQLDIPWPKPSDVAYAKKKCGKDLEIVLQVGQRSFQEVDNDVEKLTSKLLDYYGIVDRVLLDRSMGKGVPLDAQNLLSFIRDIAKHLPRMGMVVAGGLGPETMHLLLPIVAEYSQISIDAEGQLRTSHNIKDPIEWDLATIYLIKALQIFR